MSPDQLAELGKQGLLGFLLILSIGAIVYLYKGRMADWKEIADTIKMLTATLRDWIAANESRTKALDANARAQELAAAAVTQLSVEIGSLRETIQDRTGEAIKSNREMREAVLALKEQVSTLYTRCLRGPSSGGG